ncbi:hypothetical protein pb186bvf_006691 [Paramecium bursaria]
MLSVLIQGKGFIIVDKNIEEQSKCHNQLIRFSHNSNRAMQPGIQTQIRLSEGTQICHQKLIKKTFSRCYIF